jgi:RNA polymerase sigma-70 factor (ECF subfamily)
VTRAEEFEQLRPLLFAIAYRILGLAHAAEDAVQETWLRYEASPTPHTSTKAFLSVVVTRISIDVLRSARFRREEYVGQWLPEPLLTDPYEDSAELADSLSMASVTSSRRESRSRLPSSARPATTVRATGALTAWRSSSTTRTPVHLFG